MLKGPATHQLEKLADCVGPFFYGFYKVLGFYYDLELVMQLS